MAMITTIKIEIETKEKLNQIGNKGETYNDILEKLLKIYNQKN